MAAKKSADQPAERAFLAKPRDEVISRIRERIDAGRQLLDAEIASRDDFERLRERYYTWDDVNRRLLEQLFTTPAIRDQYAAFHGAVFFADQTLGDEIRDLQKDIRDHVRRLESVIEQAAVIDEAPSSASTPAVARAEVLADTFIVHGRDEQRRKDVAAFLHRLTGREPIVLHEMPNSGRTLMEKFEANASTTAFAVIIATADDEGGLLDEAERNARARQNVIFEFGYFCGAIGRKRVCLLYEDGVELPSDLAGVVYESFDGPWQTRLAREMDAAGMEIDAKVLLRL